MFTKDQMTSYLGRKELYNILCAIIFATNYYIHTFKFKHIDAMSEESE
jgi:hypothetical protein